ncbi:MAG: response regulator [Lachnospiraceae bacterium]|nr:response regulator [Lachnospiraceae bacterium]
MLKIMIVDDSRIFRKMLRAFFTENGHDVIGEAGNGLEALELLKTLTPDLITLDITMPEMDGIEALKQIKANNPKQEVIMVSAAGQNSKVIDALKIGASDFIQKPFDPEDISIVLSKLFDNT